MLTVMLYREFTALQLANIKV